jgi:hypothetical protein
MLYLTKAIDNDSYGKRREFEVKSECDSSKGLNGLISCNEAHFIPKGYDLRKKEHLAILDKCLGGASYDVSQKIKKQNPNPQFDMFGFRIEKPLSEIRKGKIKKIMRWK